MKMQSNQQKSQLRKNKCVLIIIKPLRVIQFIIVLLVLALGIYMIITDPIPMNVVACIFLIVLSAAFVFILAADLISQITTKNSHVIPVFVFSMLGLFFFGFSGVLLFTSSYTDLTVQIAAILCLLAALIFLIDVTAVLAFWKRRCVICKRCCSDVTELALRKNGEPPLTGVAAMKNHIATSVSDIKLPVELGDVEVPDHYYRKIQQPQRREYVDCTTCVPSLYDISVAEIQTEPKKISIMESQTPKPETKETPMQTLSKCEYCNQQMQSFASPLSDGVGETAMQCLQSSPQWAAYPAVLQVVRGGVGMPCCTGCKCTTDASGTQQRQNDQQQSTTKHTKQVTDTPNNRETLTSEIKQVASKSDRRKFAAPPAWDSAKVLRGGAVNVAKKGNTKSFTEAAKDAVESTICKTSGKRISLSNSYTDVVKNRQKTVQNLDETLVEEEITENLHYEKSKVIDKPAREKVGDKILTASKDFQKKIAVDKEPLTDTECVKEEPADEEYDNVERNKGGGEGRIGIWQHFLHSVDPSTAAAAEKSPKYTVATQVSTTLIGPSTSKTKSKTFPYLRSNKVDPIDETGMSTAAHGSELTELPKFAEHQMKETCSFCEKQKSLTPHSDNSRYYTVFEDKKGRNFCEFCAPLDSKKVINKIHIAKMKPRCTNCRSPLRGRTVETDVPLKCPKCGRSQRQIPSPSSM